MKTQEFQLSVAPPTVRFASDDEADLAHQLLAIEQNTKNVAISTPAQLSFNKAGCILGSLRMSTTAMGQLCSMLAPGLSLFVKDLCNDKDSPDPELAIRTLNEMVRLRFRSELEHRRLIIDWPAQRIDGIVGPKYVQLSNSDLYKRSKQFVGRDGAKFHEAVVTGRRMLVQYMNEAQIDMYAREDRPDIFHSGYHFSNSEVGECAVRAATVLIRKVCSNGAVGPVTEGGRLAHVSIVNFEERFERLLERVRKKTAEVSVIQANMPQLSAHNLELGGPSDEHRKRCEYIVKRLRKGGLPKKFASRVMTRTILCSADDIRPLASYDRPTAAAVRSRNMYDLINAITYESKNLPVSARESAEHLAYMLMLGRVSFN